MTTTTIHTPATDFPVLDRPYTVAEYNALPCIGPYGEITRIVSLPLSALLEAGFDRASEMLCKAVVGELGDMWHLHSYVALGPAKSNSHPDAETLSETGTWHVRSRIIEPVASDAITTPRQQETLFQVCMSPGFTEDENACLCDAILPCPVHDR